LIERKRDPTLILLKLLFIHLVIIKDLGFIQAGNYILMVQ